MVNFPIAFSHSLHRLTVYATISYPTTEPSPIIPLCSVPLQIKVNFFSHFYHLPSFIDHSQRLQDVLTIIWLSANFSWPEFHA
jgi:hypothetical protein